MDEPACTCGFVPTDDYHLADHLGEVFIPADDRAIDGRLHAEAARDTAPAARDTAPAASDALACRCGYRTPDGAALDVHILSAFTPPNAIGPDGRRHVPAD
jgi:hypothetical protein